MQSQLIMKRLAEKLNSGGGGNCEYDEGCTYGFGVKQCSASRAVVEDKFAAIRKEALAEAKESGIPTLAASGNFDADWPCLTCISIQFVSPDKEAVKPGGAVI
jgi:hypothetical protein